MSTFPIVKARQELGFVPATGVRADIDTRTGEGEVGQAIGQALITGGRIAIEIHKRRQQMTDANSSVIADKLRQTADAEFETFKLTNPQETWEKFREEQTHSVSQQIAVLPFSSKVFEQQRVRSESYSAISTAQALTDATRQLRKDTIDAQTEALVDAFRSGEPEKIAEASRRFSDNGANMGKDKAEVLSDIKAAREAGEKLRKQDTLDSWRDRIAEDPVATEQILENELAARKQDKGIISEGVLSSKDIQSLLNTATNRQAQLTADTEREINRVNKELETKLHDDIVAERASITDIGKSGLPAEAKRRLERDLSDVKKRDIARAWAIQDSGEATKETNAVLVSIEAGTQDINEARRALNEIARRKTADGRSILTRKTYDDVLTKIAKGGRDAIDLFTDEQTAIVTNSLTRRLTDRQARLTIRSQARTLTPLERRQFSTVGFLLQVAKHQEIIYNNSLAQRLRTLGIEDTSGIEAKAEAVKVWQSIRQKPLERQINDFLSASGQELVRPVGITVEMWDTNARNKAAIVRAVADGLNNEQIEELLIR